MINIKTAAATIAAVAVVGVSVRQYVSRTPKTKTTVVEQAVKSFYSAEFIAFNKAQDVLSARTLSGAYDDMTDAQVFAEYNVIYANFLNK